MTERNSMRQIHHKGRIRQIPIYLGKFFRMFIYQDDWKVLPMAAVIAGLVAYVTGRNIFVTQEATLKGALALICVCIWTGFFNSVQVVCREREIVKREHRNGMHISSYITAHMIYQAFLCASQSVIILFVCQNLGVPFPKEGFITPSFLVDMGITFFIVTFSADMTSLMISSMVRNTTHAMTVMPFALIFELVFSGAMFGLSGFTEKLSNLSLANWGIRVFCAQSKYNELPSATAWKQLWKMRDYTIDGMKPVRELTRYMKENHLVEQFNKEVGRQNMSMAYVHSKENILLCWGTMLLFALICALIAVLVLKRIDKDKR